MKRILYITILTVFCIEAQSQSKLWTMRECVQFATENSPKINKQDAKNIISRQDFLNALGKLIPSLNASSSAYISFGRAVDSETNTYTDVNSFSNSYSVYSSLTIFDGFSNIYKLKMQKMNTLVGKQDLEQTKEMIAYETMEAYYNVLYYKKMLQLAQSQVDESGNNLKQAQRMEELGMKAKPDISEMVAKEAADMYNLTKQRNLFNIGIILLKEKMNFPIDEDLDIEAEQAAELVVKSSDTVMSIYETTKSTNSKAQSAELALKAQEFGYRSAIGAISPTIGIEAGVSTGFVKYLDGSDFVSFAEQIKNKQGSYVGVTLSIPIFNAFSKTASLNRSKAQVEIARSERDETLRTLYSEIEQAVADMNGQAAACRQAVRQREAMETAHQVNQRKYEEGLISPLELHTSANRVMEAKAEEMKAELQYRLKARLVRYYKGESFIH